MAKLLWGQVYFKNHYAGVLRSEPGERFSFTYDASYIESDLPSISYTLPKGSNALYSNYGLHPFFDNLIAEGWLEKAQSRILGKREISRFELLLAFGFDCIGAVSVIDPNLEKFTQKLLDLSDPKELAVLHSRASLSGVQPKLAVIEKEGKFYPTKNTELSSHIVKFPSKNHNDLVANEYLATMATKILLPKEEIVEFKLQAVEGFDEEALVVKRFDRDFNLLDSPKIHFEEFNQLLNYKSHEKYDASYKEMADFMYQEKCAKVQVYRLFLRIITGILLGNTDMHLKNFAMFCSDGTFKLTPIYDQVNAAIYDYKTMALAIRNSQNLWIGSLKPGNIIALGKEFGLNADAIIMAVSELEKNLSKAKDFILSSEFGHKGLKEKLAKFVEARWRGSFALVGKVLSKMP